jgi:hypothetical protein
MKMSDTIGWHNEMAIYKFKDPDQKIHRRHEEEGVSAEVLAKEHFSDLKAVEYQHGNVACNAGLGDLLKLVFTTGGTKYDSSNAYIGVGDGNNVTVTPEAGDTDLDAPTNKLRKLVSSGPTINSQTVTMSASFGDNEGEWVNQWREVGLFNHTSAGVMLCHLGGDKGVKGDGETWVVQLSLTFS